MGTPQYLPPLDPHYRELAKVLPLCSEVAALSPRLARQWSEHFSFLPSVSVLPLIAEDPRMPDLPAALGAGAGRETIFGYAARIEPGKGPFVLLDALARLGETRKDVLVRLAGIGPALPAVKARARKLGLDGSLELVGAYQGAVGCSAFMRTLDAFVLPSFAEGTSKSVIEAMAHGLPIIATHVGGLPDLLTPDAGILVPPGDSSALADAMDRLASDPALRERLGRAARDRYLALFAPDAVLSILLTTYSRVAGARRHDVESLDGTHPWVVECRQRS
jgi:glycosyltransferase involved in cell wall biosynthesis